MLVDFRQPCKTVFCVDLVVVPDLEIDGESEEQMSFSLPGLESLSVEFSGSLKQSMLGKFIVSRFIN